MIREGKYIHISSVEEAEVVIDYYKKFGYTTRGLTLGNCLSYPYLCEHIELDKKLVSGCSRVANEKVVQFKDWLEFVGVSVAPFEEVDMEQVAMELFAGV